VILVHANGRPVAYFNAPLPGLMGRKTTGMSTDIAHKHWWQIFEVVFGIPFLVAIALQLVASLSFPRGILTLVLILGGVVCLIGGINLEVLARREYARYGQPTDHGHPTRKIVTTGVFSVSRNPLYLGGVCILIGISLALNLPWVLILLLPSIVACHYFLIVPEERYLTAKFDDKYRGYAATVHRWIGRKPMRAE
jgi:protein-S-isoprenylcysteine O-methyltransferase Ste14